MQQSRVINKSLF